MFKNLFNSKKKDDLDAWTIIGSGTRFDGNIEADKIYIQGLLVVDNLECSKIQIQTGGRLIVKNKLIVDSLEVNGAVEFGKETNIYEIKVSSGGSVMGDFETEYLSIERGAFVRSKISADLCTASPEEE
jgi:cytoskeletal protein CcmA (bactofilin family)